MTGGGGGSGGIGGRHPRGHEQHPHNIPPVDSGWGKKIATPATTMNSSSNPARKSPVIESRPSRFSAPIPPVADSQRSYAPIHAPSGPRQGRSVSDQSQVGHHSFRASVF
jgi:hypothetical protein